MTANKIEIVNLDFDGIKASIKDYLQGQSEFLDYNFEGSGLNILLDVLAYNTSMNAFMVNMKANEMFLDSAELRESVVSLAKQIGYTPRSITAAEASIKLTVNDVVGSPSELLLPKYTKFAGGNYSFITVEDYYLEPKSASVYELSDIRIFEGTIQEFQFVVDTSISTQRFILPSPNIDTTKMSVQVQTSESNLTKRAFTLHDNITLANSESEIYYLSEAENGRFEIIFGDDNLGRKLNNGNIILVKYLNVNSDHTTHGNQISKFDISDTVSGYSNITIETLFQSFGGCCVEPIESIRFNAPKHFEAQSRAVTAIDYTTLLQNKYTFIEAINVWGGEQNVPPVYGKVFISIKPSFAPVLTDEIKSSIITDFISNYNILSITPEIVDPENFYVGINCTVTYNSAQTTLDPIGLTSLISDNIRQHFTDNIKNFNSSFLYSPLYRVVDTSDRSIISSIIDAFMQLRIQPPLGETLIWDLKFNNKIEKESIYSSSFYCLINEISTMVYIADDGNGNLILKNFKTGLLLKNDLGTINYETGVISFSINVYNLTGTGYIFINATPIEKDIKPGRNQIILLNESTFDRDHNVNTGLVVNVTKQLI